MLVVVNDTVGGVSTMGLNVTVYPYKVNGDFRDNFFFIE